MNKLMISLCFSLQTFLITYNIIIYFQPMYIIVMETQNRRLALMERNSDLSHFLFSVLCM